MCAQPVSEVPRDLRSSADIILAICPNNDKEHPQFSDSNADKHPLSQPEASFILKTTKCPE